METPSGVGSPEPSLPLRRPLKPAVSNLAALLPTEPEQPWGSGKGRLASTLGTVQVWGAYTGIAGSTTRPSYPCVRRCARAGSTPEVLCRHMRTEEHAYYLLCAPITT